MPLQRFRRQVAWQCHVAVVTWVVLPRVEGFILLRVWMGGSGANFKVSFLCGQLRLHSVALICQMGEGGLVDVV